MSQSSAPDSPPIGMRELLTAGAYALVVLVLAATGVANSGFLGEAGPWPLGMSLAVLLTACVSLLWRRRRPVIPFAVAGTLSLLELIAGGQISAYLLLFEALFVPVLYGSLALARASTWISCTVGVLTMLAALIASLVLGLPGTLVFTVILLVTIMISTPLLWAWEVRHHRDAREAAEHLAALEHELASTRAARAVETERRTVAHDLHDVIAGHLSAVSLHTSLASTLEDPAARDRSLLTARESAHAALRDLRSMIGVLSTEEAGTLPTATLDWDSLAARLRGRDPAAAVSIDPATEDPAQVEPAVQAALLRIGAEAVTNAVRHGQAPLALTVQVEGEEVALTLVNGRAPDAGIGVGLGRGALTHRASAVGGSASSGPGEEAGTWQVTARVPRDQEVPR